MRVTGIEKPDTWILHQSRMRHLVPTGIITVSENKEGGENLRSLIKEKLTGHRYQLGIRSKRDK